MTSKKKNDPGIGIWIENLMDRVRVGESLKKANLEHRNLSDIDACLQFLNDPETLLIVDLQNRGIEDFGKRLPDDAVSARRIIGYFPHLQIRLKKTAEKFGIQHVVPRSVLFGDTVGLLQEIGKQIK